MRQTVEDWCHKKTRNNLRERARAPRPHARVKPVAGSPLRVVDCKCAGGARAAEGLNITPNVHCACPAAHQQADRDQKASLGASIDGDALIRVITSCSAVFSFARFDLRVEMLSCMNVQPGSMSAKYLTIIAWCLVVVA